MVETETEKETKTKTKTEIETETETETKTWRVVAPAFSTRIQLEYTICDRHASHA